eukprot:2259565-Rhodomonas_salina.3
MTKVGMPAQYIGKLPSAGGIPQGLHNKISAVFDVLDADGRCAHGSDDARSDDARIQRRASRALAHCQCLVCLCVRACVDPHAAAACCAGPGVAPCEIRHKKTPSPYTLHRARGVAEHRGCACGSDGCACGSEVRAGVRGQRVPGGEVGQLRAGGRHREAVARRDESAQGQPARDQRVISTTCRAVHMLASPSRESRDHARASPLPNSTHLPSGFFPASGALDPASSQSGSGA